MSNHRQCTERYRIRPTRIEDYAGIRQLCLEVYPFSAPYGKEQLRSQLAVFPGGQLVVDDVHEKRVAGMASSLIVNWDDYAIDDNWRDFTDGGYFRNHDPENGRTLYGAEVMIHPRRQGLGLGKRLYAARRALAEDLGLLRIRAGARLRGYGSYSGDMSPEAYLHKVLRGEIFDATVSFQLRQGFQIVALASGYLPGDPESGGWAVVIEWLNPRQSTERDRQAQINRYMRQFALREEEARHLVVRHLPPRASV